MLKKSTEESRPHWGPQIASIPLSGFIGLVVTVGLMVGFLFAVPETRLWIYIGIPIGILVAIVLHIAGRGKM